MFFIVQLNDSFNFPLGWIKYIVKHHTVSLNSKQRESESCKIVSKLTNLSPYLQSWVISEGIVKVWEL